MNKRGPLKQHEIKEIRTAMERNTRRPVIEAKYNVTGRILTNIKGDQTRTEKVMDKVYPGEFVTIKEIVRRTGMPTTTARKAVADLITTGELIKTSRTTLKRVK